MVTIRKLVGDDVDEAMLLDENLANEGRAED